MHICLYSTAYGYIRVARYTLAAVVTIVALLFFMREKKDLHIEYDSHGYWVCFYTRQKKKMNSEHIVQRGQPDGSTLTHEINAWVFTSSRAFFWKQLNLHCIRMRKN